MNKMQIFRNPEFGQIRVMTKDGQPWFAGKDVADVLGYSNTSKALLDHVDEEDKLNNESLSSLGQRGGWLINESGLYSLILSSKLPTAKKFKRWVTSEVLPQINHTGGYIPSKEGDTDEDILAKAVLIAKRTIGKKNQVIETKNKQLEQQEPKVLFADSVQASTTSILVGELAKILKQNGIEIGQNRLFAWMRDNGYLISRKGADYNMPTQKSMDLRLFTIKETTINHSDGHISVSKTPKVTGKGQVYFVNKFKKLFNKEATI